MKELELVVLLVLDPPVTTEYRICGRERVQMTGGAPGIGLKSQANFGNNEFWGGRECMSR